MENKSSGKAVKAGVGYTIGNVLVRGISFLSLPIFSRIMTTDQFGVYNVFVSYEAILYVVIGCAIHSSMQSANIEFKNRIDDYASSVSLIYILNAVVLLAVVQAFGGTLSQLLDFDKVILCLLVLYSLGSAILALYNNRISISYDYKRYLMIALFNAVGNVLLSLLLMFTVFSDRRDYGRIIGSTGTLFIISILILSFLYRKEKPKFNKIYWKFALKYSLPIVPHGISQVLLAQFDRIMIRALVNNAAAGIYSLAGNIKLVLTIITESVTTAWRTWFYSEMNQGNIKLIQEKAIQVSGLFVIFAVGLMAISPEMIFILGGKEYARGRFVAIPMIMDAFILFLYNVIVQSEYYSRKTVYIMFGTMIAAAINIITNYIFINLYGFIAAAYTTLFSYICYLILHIVISYKQVHFSVIPLKWLAGWVAIVGVCGALDLVFIDCLAVRWILCISIVAALGMYLLKRSGYEEIIKRRVVKK